MKFIKNFEHLTVLKIALGISLFSVGYLITMFYFQMQSLEIYKHHIENYNKAIINVVQLESEIERNNYYLQSEIFNVNVQVS
jgi:hypothetical protein